jgi:hypothetical protein
MPDVARRAALRFLGSGLAAGSVALSGMVAHALPGEVVVFDFSTGALPGGCEFRRAGCDHRPLVGKNVPGFERVGDALALLVEGDGRGLVDNVAPLVGGAEFEGVSAFDGAMRVDSQSTSSIPHHGGEAFRYADVVLLDALPIARPNGTIRMELPSGARRHCTLLETESGEINLGLDGRGCIFGRVGEISFTGSGDASRDTIFEFAWCGQGVTAASGHGEQLTIRAAESRSPGSLSVGRYMRVLNAFDGTRPTNRHIRRVAFYADAGPVIAVAAPAYAPPSYKVVFEDDFNDADVGRINEFGNPHGASPGWRSRMHHPRFDVINQEKQIYMDRRFSGTATHPLGVHPFKIENGVLSIIADRADPLRVKPFIKGYSYTSGCITSELTHAQTYGFFEIRCKCPLGRGFWPAFWLLPKRPTWPPEIDPLEASGIKRFSVRQGSIGGTDARYPSRWIDGVIDIADGFHVYAVEWTAEWLIFSIDGVESLRQPNFVHEDMYVIANLALGSKDQNWIPDPDNTTPLPSVFDIDYIRCWNRL